MSTLPSISLLASMLGAGLIAGLCFAFSSFLMTSFDRLGPAQAIRTMQSLNAVILRSAAMAVWFGTALLGIAAAVLTHGAPLAVAAAILYLVGAVGITGFRNVPLNEALDEVEPDSPEAENAWRQYRLRWSRWNTLRTFVCALASLGFALAL